MGGCSDCWLSWVPSLRDQSELCIYFSATAGLQQSVSRYDGDPQWSETGDRYLLKLFRDYLFHQVLPSGAPWVDLSHIVQSLNKVGGNLWARACPNLPPSQLDAGVSENIMLHSRDEQSVLIVSYADLKSCIDGTFSQLTSASSQDM